MPRIDDGPTDGPPGKQLKSAWVTLTTDEARELFLALAAWDEEVSEGQTDPGWHTHITDADGNELTVAVSPDSVESTDGVDPR
jgi:hypothetical protein